MSERDGPQVITTHRLVCDGCKHLKTEDWSFMGENDDLDRGTDATCHADGERRPISAYWHKGNEAPKWCPRRIVLS